MRDYRASAHFPVERGEQIAIRDGNGNVVERWNVVSAPKPDGDHRYFTVEQEGYRDASSV